MKLLDPSTLKGWLQPHSIEWYEQLSNYQDEYKYPWNSTIIEPNGESVFDGEVAHIIANKNVLDVGCGHGEFTVKCGLLAKETVGFDVTDNFIEAAKQNKNPNVKFISGNTKNGLPFSSEEFDCAYIRKGPTSAYPLLKQFVKRGGEILGLHPGDMLGKELHALYPNLYEKTEGTPILDTIKQRVKKSNFSLAEFETINSVEYLHSPYDVLKLRCFGQTSTIYRTLKRENLTEISRVFEQNATKDGLPITFARYIVRVIV
ncbi:class I SAM-dependent methyltransferase [Virgibacillus sp. DJP39]|uniref:class I SAM-dependent methyltransferase n=1 Tax=Virgibacillus sp. DJP39 TaxID=3409790 RepID=UPI003BB536D9